MSRILLIISLLAFAGITLPVVLFAQAQARSAFQVDEWFLESDNTKGNLVNGTFVWTGNVYFISPKKPPYNLEIRCQRMEADGSNKTTTVITATDGVTFSAVTKTDNGDTFHITGKSEKMLCQVSKPAKAGDDPNIIVKFFRAKNRQGVDVSPYLEVRQEGSKDSYVIEDSNSITYNLKTGEYESTASKMGTKAGQP